jgi:hypothetical protein
MTAARAGTFFKREFREHVGRSTSCICTFDGPDPGCNVGYSLWTCATRPQVPVVQSLEMREMLRPPHPRATAR